MSEELRKEPDSTIQLYREFVLRRECTKDKDLQVRLDHAITGMVTESGELAGIMKKVKFYGKSQPKILFYDEMADVFHYLVMGMNALDITFEDLIRLNQTKLRARSPEGFSVESATEKNKEKEQKAVDEEMKNLEQGEVE
jgi:NTP pyrophosphatase (non-canonical NTP hydrolase)